MTAADAPTIATIAVLVLAALAATLRLAWNTWRAPAPARPRAWRTLSLLVLQAAATLLLYFTLFPPEQAVPGGRLVVLTPGADTATVPAAWHTVALPGAEAVAGAERMPDLGTALRRYPGTTQLHVVGAGLPERDLAAATGLPVTFEPPPLPAGIVELWAPARVQAGDTFMVRGRVHGVRGGRVELMDPAARRVARLALAGDGTFQMQGEAVAAGAATFEVRVRDARGRVVETAAVPLQVTPPPTRAMLLMSGAPNPEARFLQRWAVDAGMTVQAQASLGAGVRIGDAPIPFDAASLGRFDVAVLDERAWQDLGAAAHAALRKAVAEGLGLVVRVSGPLSTGGRARLAGLGLPLGSAPLDTVVQLPSAAPAPDAGRDGDSDDDSRGDRHGGGDDATDPAAHPGASAALPPLSRRALRVTADDAVAILRDAAGEPLAVARNHGRGRVALVLVSDTWRLALAGHGTHHARLWSGMLSAVARPGPPPGPRVAGAARAGGRVVLCDVASGSMVRAPDGARTPLHVDPETGAACAGFWPRDSGWHHLETAHGVTPFHVDAAGSLPAARALELRERTLALVAAATDTGTRDGASAPGARWPWFIALLAVLALLWWLERSPSGRR